MTYECTVNDSRDRPESAVAIAKIENRLCQHCDKIFSSVRQYKVCGGWTMRYRLDDFSTDFSLSLQVHVTQFHRPKKCGVCQKTFSSQIELREHKRIEHELHISFRCPICERAFSGELNLHRHIQTHTDPATPLSCSICGYVEKNSDELDAHVSQHNNRLECTVCGKVLKHKSNLVLHMRIHVSFASIESNRVGSHKFHAHPLSFFIFIF